MIEGIRVSSQFLAFNRHHFSLTQLSRTVPGASVLALSILMGAWALSEPTDIASKYDDASNSASASRVAEAPVVDEAHVVAEAAKVAPTAIVPNPYGAMLRDLRSRSRVASASPAPIAEPEAVGVAPAASLPAIEPSKPVAALPAMLSVPPKAPAASLQIAEKAAESAPLPPRRPTKLRRDVPKLANVEDRRAPVRLAAPRVEPRIAPQVAAPQVAPQVAAPLIAPRVAIPQVAQRQQPTVAQRTRPLSRREARREARRMALATPPADNRSFFEKLFGLSQPSGSALGYASAESGVSSAARSIASASSPAARNNGGGSYASARLDRYTAIYDISAHTVYLPNGARLEAHSGLGQQLDDPRSVHIRMRGATPPHLYDLTLRESLFHGVQALRLNPIGGGGIYGRGGLLAHTYMLGPNGDSNGCVSFEELPSFPAGLSKRGNSAPLAVVASLN